MINAKEQMEKDFKAYWKSIEINNFSKLTYSGVQNLLADAFFEAFKAGLSFEMLRAEDMKKMSILESDIIG